MRGLVGRVRAGKARRTAVLGSLVTVAVSAFGCDSRLPAESRLTRLRAAYTSAVDIGDLPSLLAHRSLAKDGYQVESTFFAQPELAVEALARGDVDVASGGARPFWAAVAKGADLVMVMEHSENGYQMVTGPDVERCEGLDGRTLALSSRGSLPTALGEAYLQRCPAAKPRLLILPHSGDRLAALLMGAVDAAVLQRADVTRLDLRAPGRFRTLEAFSSAFPDLDLEGVFVTRSFLTAQRLVVVDYIRERIRANREVLANPALLFEESRRWPTIGTIDSVVVEGEVRAPAWTRDGGLTPDSVTNTLNFFVQSGSLPPSLSPGRLADFSPQEEALQAVEGDVEDLAGLTREHR